MNRVYLDHAATTPLSPAALEAMRRHLADEQGNPSSVHWEGQRARAAVEEARTTVARALGVEDDEVVFTSSGTEADNLALRGAAWAAPDRCPHVVTTAIEHDAVRRTVRWLDARGDAEVTLVPPGPGGAVSAEDVVAALRDDTALVSIIGVNNETGVVQPVEAIGAACRARGITFHVDAVQALGRLPVRPRDVPADLLSLSAHKVGGPKGCGVLFVRRGVKLQPVLTGGGQEMGLRAGTENVAAIVGAAHAMAEAVACQPAWGAWLAALSQHLEEGLLAVPGTVLNGWADGRAPGITNVSLEGTEGEAVLQALDIVGFSASTGSACTSGSTAPSHVLSAMGLSRDAARAAIRFSLGPANTLEEVRSLLETLPAVLATVRAAVAG